MSLTSRFDNADPLTDRIDAFYRDHAARTHNPDRREAVIEPVVEHRNGDERRLSRWITWTRENEKSGKVLSGPVAS